MIDKASCKSSVQFSCYRNGRRMFMAKNYEELTIADDFMFGKVMEDKELCRAVLECLLNQPVGEPEEIQAEREFRYITDGKPVRLDVYTRDQKSIYDAEMQNLNHQKAENLELPKRSRFYQSSMDTDHLRRGKSYRELPEGKVLFICTFDPFGKGYAQYSFQNICTEDKNLYLKDGTEKIFYNSTSQSENISENLRLLYQYITTGQIGNHLTEKIEKAVVRAKKNEAWRAEYMKELLHDDDVRQEGIQEGIQQTIAASIGICKDLGLSFEETTRRLQEKLNLTEEELRESMKRYW